VNSVPTFMTVTVLVAPSRAASALPRSSEDNTEPAPSAAPAARAEFFKKHPRDIGRTVGLSIWMSHPFTFERDSRIAEEYHADETSLIDADARFGTVCSLLSAASCRCRPNAVGRRPCLPAAAFFIVKGPARR
jgi:hypothetical protein